MIKMIRNDDNIAYGIKEFVCDSPEDIEKLPKNVEMGSTCLIISTAEVYMMNSVQEWVKL